MSNKKITCLACGVFKNEIEALARQGKLDLDIVTLESMLHMKPALLEQEMGQALEASPNDTFLLLYGDCHPRMREMQNKENVSKVVGINCCEIFLGKEAYRTLQREEAFIFLPEWTLRWQEVFTMELGFEDPQAAQEFMKEYRKKLVYIDTGVMPIPESILQDISAFFDMPVEILHISLDVLSKGIQNTLRKLERPDHHDSA
jgi:hypothetical protein